LDLWGRGPSEAGLTADGEPVSPRFRGEAGAATSSDKKSFRLTPRRVRRRLVRRKHAKKYYQYRKRDPRLFLLEIQQRFKATSEDDWYSGGEVRRLVLDYYVVLRSVLREKRWVRRLLTRCRLCGIFFIADPRNVGREDLCCPFGCAALHRRRESNKRSVRYNGLPKGKLKRYEREEKRRLAAKRVAAEALKAREIHLAVTAEEAQDAVPRSVEPLPRDQGAAPSCPPPEAASPATEQEAPSAEATPGGSASCSMEECGGPSPRERGASAGFPPGKSEQPEFDPGIVSYIRVVISVLEGRQVHREEILEMLARAKRQRSLARERRIHYVLRRLREEPEKPP